MGNTGHYEDIEYNAEFRLLVMAKYVYIGASDICFWWSVWILSDRWYPMDITKDGAYSYLRGYLMVLLANFIYFAIRIVGVRTFNQHREDYDRDILPTVIVTRTKNMRKRSRSFHFLRATFPLCIYILVVGYIQIWRGLFATFNFLIEYLHTKYSVNFILSCITAQLIVALTLAFTQNNNAVNLCPTHKMYKHDELYFTDYLFNLNQFGNFRKATAKVSPSVINLAESTGSETNTDSKYRSSSSLNLIDDEFDMAKFMTTQFIYNLNQSRIKNRHPHRPFKTKDSRKANQKLNPKEKWNDLYQFALDYTRENSLQNPFIVQRQNIKTCSKWSIVQKHFLLMNKSIDVKQTTSDDKVLLVSNLPAIEEELKDKAESMLSDKNEIPINVAACEDSEKEKKTTHETLDMGRLMKHSYGTYAKEMDHRERSRSGSENLRRHGQRKMSAIFTKARTFSVLKEPTIEKAVSIKEEYLIQFLGYLYAIHHRQIFLHIFGGLFWSTTWKLYDYATVTVFTKTASDLPDLVLIAVFCHCINHLVLFRLKETSSGIYWKTFWEFFCGLFTVCLWASVWYIWDLILNAIGAKYLVETCLVLNALSFVPLVFLKLSINTAL